MTYTALQTLEHLLEYKVKEDARVQYLPAKIVDSLTEKSALYFSQLIAAMANSQGGTIYIGVKSVRKIPRTIEPIENAKALDWLNFVVANAIQPAIQLCTVEQIEVAPQKYIILIRVPNSAKAPHMSADNRYYKRVQASQEIMEEQEVRDMYIKGKRAELELYAITNAGGIPAMSGGKFSYVNFYPRFLVKNTGNSMERFFKVEISIPSQISNPNFDTLQNHFSRFQDGNSVYSIAHNQPFFQNELATIIEANIVVDADNFHIFESGVIEISLFFSAGVEQKIFNCKDIFTYKNKQLDIQDFVATRLELDRNSSQPTLMA